ncbi:MAG: hypothetical protein WBQ53_17040, partial [Methylocystis sp.]
KPGVAVAVLFVRREFPRPAALRALYRKARASCGARSNQLIYIDINCFLLAVSKPTWMRGIERTIETFDEGHGVCFFCTHNC